MSDDYSGGGGGEKRDDGSDSPGERGPPSRSGAIKLDTVFDSLTNRRRRFVLYHLQQHDDIAKIDELARQVAAWEAGTGLDQVTDEQYQRVFTDLFHTHLPKLSDSGIVDYDERTGVVRLWEHATLLKNVLQLASWLERPESE